MGIYISGVKGLPEQVQENKNKIKEVEEQIEGIDFEAVRQLQGQVAENTQDINNLEASIGVQNQAINSLNNDVDALESKTQKISYNEQSGELTIDANVNVKRINITAAQTPLTADSMVSRDDKNAISLTGANDEISLIVGRTGTQHILNFNADGTLDIDGQAVGGKPLYEHNLKLTILNSPIVLQLITDNATAFTNLSLRDFLRGLGYTTSSNKYNIYSMVFDGTTHYIVEGLYGTTADLYAFYAEVGATTGTQKITFLSDKVRQIN